MLPSPTMFAALSRRVWAAEDSVEELAASMIAKAVVEEAEPVRDLVWLGRALWCPV